MTDEGGMTHGELQRRIADLASTTLRKDVYDADERRREEARRADRAELHDLDGDVGALREELDEMKKTRDTDRRLLLASLAYPLIVGAILLILQGLVK